MANGGHVVAWQGFGSPAIGDTDAGGVIYYRVYDAANGTSDTTPRVANTNLAGGSSDPIGIATANGGFALAWVANNFNVPNSGSVTRIQFFDSTGAKVGSEATFSLTPSSEGPRTIAQDIVQIGSLTGLLVRDNNASSATTLLLFDPGTGARTADLPIALGTAVDEVFGLTNGNIGTLRRAFSQGVESNVFEVRTIAGALVSATTFGFSTSGGQYSTETLTDGRIAVAYATGNSRQVVTHVIAADGSSIGPAVILQLAADAILAGVTPQLVAHQDGGFSVIFDARLTGTTSNFDVFGQRYSASSEPLGPIFQVNTVNSANTQLRSVVDQLSDGNFVVAWEDSRGGASSANGVFAREFSLPAAPQPPTEGSDTITGTAANDTLSGLGGNDSLSGEDGDDVIDGGSGNDTIFGGTGSDRLDGGLGDDLIWGGSGLDNITGGEGADVVLGEDGDDLLFGWFGNDTIYGWIGRDTIRGEEGDDVLFGELGDDIVFGDAGVDVVWGGDGADLLYGWEGADTLLGEAGNDTLFGEQDQDVLYGWLGADLLWGGDGNDVLWGEQDNDTLLGETGDDVLLGIDGDDLAYGWLGNDSLYGWTGNDVLFGEQGNDLILGEDGADTIVGGLGRDTMTGRGGRGPLLQRELRDRGGRGRPDHRL